MEKKLYTLQECFEACGSKFPFTVDWFSSFNGIQKGFIITHKTKQGHWVHKKHPDYSADTFSGEQKAFDYKIYEYNKDFEKLIFE